MNERIFISSVQKELAEERRAIRDYIRGDALFRRLFDVFLFEDLPASDRRADEVYLDEVGRCAIYVGLFGQEYGHEDAAGLSPTEHEFNQAAALGKPRLIYVKGEDDHRRHPKMRALVLRAGAQLIRRRFNDINALNAALYASLVDHLERIGRLRTRPFDAAACPDATLADLAEDKLKWFLGLAGRERQYPIPEDTPPAEALAHLNLLDAGQPSHADRPRCRHARARTAGAGHLRTPPRGRRRSDRQRRCPSRLHQQRQRAGHAFCRPPGSLESR